VNFFETQCRIVPKCTTERQQLTELHVIYTEILTPRIHCGQGLTWYDDQLVTKI